MNTAIFEHGDYGVALYEGQCDRCHKVRECVAVTTCDHTGGALYFCYETCWPALTEAVRERKLLKEICSHPDHARLYKTQWIDGSESVYGLSMSARMSALSGHLYGETYCTDCRTILASSGNKPDHWVPYYKT